MTNQTLPVILARPPFASPASDLRPKFTRRDGISAINFRFQRSRSHRALLLRFETRPRISDLRSPISDLSFSAFDSFTPSSFHKKAPKRKMIDGATKKSEMLQAPRKWIPAEILGLSLFVLLDSFNRVRHEGGKRVDECSAKGRSG